MNIHFVELKQRLVYCIFFMLSVFSVLFYYSDVIYDLFSIPIKNQLPQDSNIIATHVTSTFLIPFKLAINLSLIVSAPYIIFNIWNFMSPGLYKHEKLFILPFVIFSISLFLLGLVFSFYIICPLALNFFMTCAPSNVSVMISLTSYMDFMFAIMLSSGFSFQIPIVIYTITKCDIISKSNLSKKRSYVFILSFILGMVLTPPDVVSQVLLAIPIWLLFELGLFFSK